MRLECTKLMIRDHLYPKKDHFIRLRLSLYKDIVRMTLLTGKVYSVPW